MWFLNKKKFLETNEEDKRTLSSLVLSFGCLAVKRTVDGGAGVRVRVRSRKSSPAALLLL